MDRDGETIHPSLFSPLALGPLDPLPELSLLTYIRKFVGAEYLQNNPARIVPMALQPALR